MRAEEDIAGLLEQRTQEDCSLSGASGQKKLNSFRGAHLERLECRPDFGEQIALVACKDYQCSQLFKKGCRTTTITVMSAVSAFTPLSTFNLFVGLGLNQVLQAKIDLHHPVEAAIE